MNTEKQMSAAAAEFAERWEKNFLQARRYVVSLPVSEHPRWIVTCNFSEFLIYDMELPNGDINN